MQVPLSYVDAVIGSAGANISYIRKHSGATVSIQEGVPGEMTVEIVGSASQVQTAQQLIKVFPFVLLRLHQFPRAFIICIQAKKYMCDVVRICFLV
jgi:hypothetical protein